ncbi:hypothetical protein NM688_g6992 [Phlebia brevispora]|uniref:Uncharacterized protein n=1 Tax=Phlebia brevispora TaxID=194682 RepID=A0ACC1SA94_9APHY|nr:hypothetical protein NM688_g6992 [Phlebia brevispora]
MHASLVILGLSCIRAALAIVVPASPPSTAKRVDPALLSVSIEFFAFPGYTELAATSNCLANIAVLRGAEPAIRIGGTTQDRATFDPTLSTAVNYTVASPADAPDSLTFGPPFITLASQLKGPVTMGLNRQLNNQTASLGAAILAKDQMTNLFAIELGNEPEFWASDSPIIVAGGQGWNQDLDAASEKSWFTTLSTSVGNIFQGAVTLSWSAGGLLTRIGTDGIALLRSLSRHSYPQSACGGASTNLTALMSHSGIVSYTSQFESEAAAAHAAGIDYFLGETNSATCGGGGISPTFGAALWIMDYVLQGALIGADRLYFHQGTISNCAYCFWGESSIFSPYYGAAFVSEFLGRDGAQVAMLDDGTSEIGVYAIYSASNRPVRLLVVNSNNFDGTGTRSSANVSFTGLATAQRTIQAKRMTAPSATSQVDEGAAVTIGGSISFNPDCSRTGVQTLEVVSVRQDAVTVRAAACVCSSDVCSANLCSNGSCLPPHPAAASCPLQLALRARATLAKCFHTAQPCPDRSHSFRSNEADNPPTSAAAFDAAAHILHEERGYHLAFCSHHLPTVSSPPRLLLMCASVLPMAESKSSARVTPKAGPSFVQLNGEMVEFTKAGNISRMRSHRGNKPAIPQTHLCHICPAKFTRITHLHRHLRTRRSSRILEGLCANRRVWRSDTNERTYKCDKCHTQFTRSDLLTRHKRSCGDPANANRSRRKSCQACADGKTKCDLQQPCSRCKARDRECVYVRTPATKARRSPADASQATASSSRSPEDTTAGLPLMPNHPQATIPSSAGPSSSPAVDNVTPSPSAPEIYPSTSGTHSNFAQPQVPFASSNTFHDFRDPADSVSSYASSVFSDNTENLAHGNGVGAYGYSTFAHDAIEVNNQLNALFSTELFDKFFRNSFDDPAVQPLDSSNGQAATKDYYFDSSLFPFPTTTTEMQPFMASMPPPDLNAYSLPQEFAAGATITNAPAVSTFQAPLPPTTTIPNPAVEPTIIPYPSEYQQYIHLFYNMFLVQMPIMHIGTFTVDGKPELLISAMQACGALYVKTRAAGEFIETTLDSARARLVHIFSKVPPGWEEQTHLILAVLLLQTIGLFHKRQDQRANSNIYHGMLVNMIRQSALIDRVSKWVPPATQDEAAWREWACVETTKRYVFEVIISTSTNH